MVSVCTEAGLAAVRMSVPGKVDCYILLVIQLGMSTWYHVDNWCHKLTPEEFECQIKISSCLEGLFDIGLDLNGNSV
jgi:hypothetical protein